MQCPHWIDIRRPARGDVAREEGNSTQDQVASWCPSRGLFWSRILVQLLGVWSLGIGAWSL